MAGLPTESPSDKSLGLPPRQAALRVLQEHESTGAYLKDLFPRFLDSLTAQDKALARTLALGLLRHRTFLDFHIDRLAPRGVSHPGLRGVLRLGAFQILLLDGIPVHAAVNTTVELARRKFGKPLAGFANALLKNLSRQGLQKPPGDGPESLAVATSHPLWLVRRWCLALGEPEAVRALHRSNEEAPVWLRVNPLRTTLEEAMTALRAADLTGEPDPEAPLFLRLRGGSDKVLRLPLFAAGGLSFQDPAAYFVARLLRWEPGLSALDFCSAPGGKAALLLEMALAEGSSREGHGIVCADNSPRRLRRIGDAQNRLGHRSPRGALWPVAQDGLRPALKTAFDRVLADVPCSNLGVIGRRPEARWRVRETDLREQAKTQLALLTSAAASVASQGRLVYATCSPEPEETREVVAAFLAGHGGFRLDDASDRIPQRLVRDRCLHLYPGETDYDGFFAAALVRVDG